jgi:glucose-1-phosphate cytidylyltransferase
MMRNRGLSPTPKVVLLAGGMGTRLREETEFKPKPMVHVGGRPILWHIMKMYSSFGFEDFVICLGYKGEMIKEYFLNYEFMNNDITIDVDRPREITVHSASRERGWRITLADTGLHTMTGARIKRVEPYVDTELFLLTYGDGLADIDISRLVEYHVSHGRIATVTGVRPPSRFGELVVEGGQVVEFSEKPQVGNGGLINGGFFVMDRRVFNYLDAVDTCVLEKAPLERLAQDGQLMVYQHLGFWQCMDTIRDVTLLNELWDTGKAPWKLWPEYCFA